MDGTGYDANCIIWGFFYQSPPTASQKYRWSSWEIDTLWASQTIPWSKGNLTTWYGSRAIEPWKNAQKSDEFLKRFPPFRSGATDANRVGRDSLQRIILEFNFCGFRFPKATWLQKNISECSSEKTDSQPQKMLSFNPPTWNHELFLIYITWEGLAEQNFHHFEIPSAKPFPIGVVNPPSFGCRVTLTNPGSWKIYCPAKSWRTKSPQELNQQGWDGGEGKRDEKKSLGSKSYGCFQVGWNLWSSKQ